MSRDSTVRNMVKMHFDSLHGLHKLASNSALASKLLQTFPLERHIFNFSPPWIVLLYHIRKWRNQADLWSHFHFHSAGNLLRPNFLSQAYSMFKRRKRKEKSSTYSSHWLVKILWKSFYLILIQHFGSDRLSK